MHYRAVEKTRSLSDALVEGRIRVSAAPRWVRRREMVGVGRSGGRVPLAVGRGVDTRLAAPVGNISGYYGSISRLLYLSLVSQHSCRFLYLIGPVEDSREA